MKKLALAIVLSATTMPAIAQKKPTAPPAVNPEIAFVDTKTRYPEIKLANGDLTGAFVVFRSVAEYMMPRYDLSPRGQNQVAVTNGGAAEIVTWSSNGSTVTITKEPLSVPGGRAGSVSFSPDGTRIAVFYDNDYKMRIFDAATRQVLSEWPVPFVSSMTYYGDGSKIAFITYGQPSIFELDVATGAVSSYPFALGKLEHLGDGHGSNALVVTYRLDEAIPESLYFGRWEAGVMVHERIAQGWDAKYNCSETRIVYRATGMHPPTYIYNVTSNSGSLLTKNSEVRRVDYVPTC